MTTTIVDEDARLLGEAVRALLTRRADSAALRAALLTPDGFDRNLWAVLCEQVGAAGVAVPEEYGGAGAGAIEATVVAAELGRMLTPSPMLGSAGFAAALLLAAGDDEACGRLLPGIAEGSRVVSVAAADDRGRIELSSIPVSATTQTGDGHTLTGTASYVLDAAVAQDFLVVADLDGTVGLFEVARNTPGLRVSGGHTMDATRPLFDVEFDSVPARRLAAAHPADALHRALTHARLLLAAEQAGAAARCLELTVDYSKTRRQFGRPIGSFQALKHRMADLHVLVESARATVSVAAAAFDSGADATVDVAVAGLHCSEAFRAVAADCIQLHGGIAITWEHDMHLFFKRAHGSAMLFGEPVDLLTSLDAAAGLPAVAR